MTSAAYFSRALVPFANSWSCARGMFSDPSMFASPGQRSRGALFQPDSRCVTELAAGAADIECTALGVEVHTPAIQRRFDAERHAERFADRRSRPDGPHRKVDARR